MMRSVTHLANRPLLAAVGLLSLFTGCAYSPYGPYGGSGYGAYPGAYGGYPGGYPTPYQAPIQTLTPGQPYIPNGSEILPQGSTIPGGQPTFQGGGGSGLTPIPEGDSTNYNPDGSSVNVPDPYFNGAGGSSSSTMETPFGGADGVQPANHLEPLPIDRFNEVRADPMTPTASLDNPWPNAPTQQYSPEPAPQETPLQNEFQTPNIPSSAPPQASPNSIDTFNPFAPPGASVPSQPADVDPSATAQRIPTGDPSSFAYGANHQWLRGIVSRDPLDGSWSIVYSDNPAQADQLAGHVSLAPSPYLEQLSDGDVVEIHGEVDMIARDGQGKPVYLIQQLKKLAESRTTE